MRNRKSPYLRMEFQAQHKDDTNRFQDARFDIIELDDGSIGRVYVDRRQSEFHVIDIALLAEYRERSIGGVLIQKLLDEAAEAGCRRTT